MKKFFMALSLVFALNSNTVAEVTTGDVLEVTGFVGTLAGGGILIWGMAKSSANSGVGNSERTKDGNDVAWTGLYIMGGGVVVWLIGFVMNELDGNDHVIGSKTMIGASLSSPKKSNLLAEHLQLGILPNAKAGYAGLKFNL